MQSSTHLIMLNVAGENRIRQCWMLVSEHTCVRLDNPVAVLWLICIDTAVQLEAALNFSQTERVILAHMGRLDSIVLFLNTAVA